MYRQHMLLKLRKPILKNTLNKNHVHCISSFKHLNLPISIKIPVTLYSHDSYITLFDFMNYVFAKLVCHGSNIFYLVRIPGCGSILHCLLVGPRM